MGDIVPCQRCTQRAVVEREPFTGTTREYCPHCGYTVGIRARRLAPRVIEEVVDEDASDLAPPERTKRGQSRLRLLTVLPKSRAAARNAQELADAAGLSHGSVSSILGILVREGAVRTTRIENAQRDIKGWRIVTGYWRVA